MRDRFVIFLGAGASRPLGVPTSMEFLPAFLRRNQGYRKLWKSLRESLQAAGYRRPLDLESTMTLLDTVASRDPVAYLEETVEPILFLYAGSRLKSTIHRTGLRYRKAAFDMSSSLKNFVRDQCARPDFDAIERVYDPFMGALGELANRLGMTVTGHSRGFRVPPFDSFTTNYDLAFERYGRGLVGSQIRTGFDQQEGSLVFSLHQLHDSSNPYLILHLHGSIGMIRLGDGRVVWSEVFAPDFRMTSTGEKVEGEVMIYPVLEKQRTQFPFPQVFSAFYERLREARVVVFAGFSFRDHPILGLLHDASRPSQLTVVVSQTAEEVVQKRIGNVLRSSVVPVSARLGSPDIGEKIAAVARGSP